MKFNQAKFSEFVSYKSIRSVTLIELMISIMIIGVLIVGFYGFQTFINTQVIDSERKAMVQNSLVYCLEHMSKYIQQANGDKNNPAIKVYPPGNPRGFEVRVDFNGTPSDLTDDPWIRYQLRPPNDILEVSCNGGVGCPASFNEDLSVRILSGFVNSSILPDPLPANPSGFYVLIEDGGSSINIGLVGRYDPTQPVITVSGSVNPQVTVKTKIICNSSSAN